MKKFALLFACAAVAMITGCEGDSPSGTGGDMPVVTGVTIDWTASDGNQIVIGWSAVTDAEGYKVWFSETSGGTVEEVGDVAGTTYTHTADCAGYYYVTAYNGGDSSSGYSTAVNTMPYVANGSYTIYDNYAPAELPSGFFFDIPEGEAISALGGGHDIYAYDPGEPTPNGDLWFYSGDMDPFAAGQHTEMVYYDGGNAGLPPTSGWATSYEILKGDVIYCWLEGDLYVKMYISNIEGPVSPSANGTLVDFTYEMQYDGSTDERAGICVFTTDTQ